MFRFASSVVLGTLLVGCATGGAAPRPTSRAGEQPVAPQPDAHVAGSQARSAEPESKWPGAAEADSGASSRPQSSPAPGSRREGRIYDEAPREDRPGLGTEWGDTRTSQVTDAPFERRSPNSPWATTTLYYNDASGIQAMTRGAAPSSYAASAVAVAGGALTVRLVDASGSPLPAYDLGSRQYVTGRHGDRYVIQILNHTGQRFEAVTSVDGLDVIDGRPGSFAKRGYLIAPWGSLEIEGFRRSMDEVAEFRFGRVASSYAARTGSERNVGVIGVAFFEERGARNPWLEREAERRHDADPFPGRFAPPPR